MDHTKHTPLAAEKIIEANFLAALIYGAQAQHIGIVAHVEDMGPSARIMVDLGGILGCGSRPVALDISPLNVMGDEGGTVHAVPSWTREQVRDMPEHYL